MQVAQGATTLWENWSGGDVASTAPGTPSHNHHFSEHAPAPLRTARCGRDCGGACVPSLGLAGVCHSELATQPRIRDACPKPFAPPPLPAPLASRVRRPRRSGRHRSVVPKRPGWPPTRPANSPPGLPLPPSLGSLAARGLEDTCHAWISQTTACKSVRREYTPCDRRLCWRYNGRARG